MNEAQPSEINEISRIAARTGGGAMVTTGAMVVLDMAADETHQRELIRLYADAVIATATSLLKALEKTEPTTNP